MSESVGGAHINALKKAFVGVSSIFTAFSLTILALRIIVRFRGKRKLWIDDYLIIVGFVGKSNTAFRVAGYTKQTRFSLACAGRFNTQLYFSGRQLPMRFHSRSYDAP